ACNRGLQRSVLFAPADDRPALRYLEFTRRFRGGMSPVGARQLAHRCPESARTLCIASHKRDWLGRAEHRPLHNGSPNRAPEPSRRCVELPSARPRIARLLPALPWPQAQELGGILASLCPDRGGGRICGFERNRIEGPADEIGNGDCEQRSPR